ncbi:uncharacterized protein METZ01_LOCUS170832 [marine metagenome]|uniref:Uncharacterized protein n=1 Tax=marine metagenome TaxID=408172 RepID=A0A382BVZ4_9ZZZZ
MSVKSEYVLEDTDEIGEASIDLEG